MGCIPIPSQGTEFPPGAADGARLVLAPQSILVLVVPLQCSKMEEHFSFGDLST